MTKDQALEDTRADLHDLLQKAVMLELSTIPAYATACYSIKEQSQYDRSAPQIVNAEPIEVIRQVMVEEMLHMVLAANVLNALRGRPRLNDPAQLPHYPKDLLDGKGPTICLRRFTPAQIKSFRDVEWAPPEDADGGDYHTIGAFYRFVIRKLTEACKTHGAARLFTGDPGRQIGPGDYYGAGGEVIMVNGDPEQCRERALAALHEILAEGEGAHLHSVACDGDRIPGPEERWDIAHFFKFSEILHSRYYQPTDHADEPPSGGDLAVDWSAVWPMKDDPKDEDYAAHPELMELSRQFNALWTELLDGLDAAFNGEKHALARLVPLMYRLKDAAQRLMRVPLPGTAGETAGPTWRYLGRGRG